MNNMPFNNTSIADMPPIYLKDDNMSHRIYWMILLDAKNAVGTWSIEEKTIRLMAWTAGRLHRQSRIHSLIYDPFTIILHGEAWCDQHALVFCFLCHCLLNLQARSLAVLHEDGINGHTMAEVLFDGAWHLFDPHPMNVNIYRAPNFGRILSYQQIAHNIKSIKLNRHWWHGANSIGKRGFFTAKAKIVSITPGPTCQFCILVSACPKKIEQCAGR
jgi:hypothetical protein